MKYDLCCIGYITLDKVVTPQKTVHMPGGTSFYFAHAIKHLNTEGFQLVTALADSEMPVVNDLRRDGIEVKVLPSTHSICFENMDIFQGFFLFRPVYCQYFFILYFAQISLYIKRQ